MKDKFFSNITHELRTPLSLILSPVEFYLQRPEQLKNAPQLLRTVYKNSNYLLSLINQLLDISKLDAGKMQVSLSKGRFGAYIGELAIAFEEESAKRQITLHFEINVSEEYLFDSEHWKKIVNNLLSNALKFTSANGHVYVLVKKIGDGQKGDTIQLVVKDTGIGIKKEQLPFITDRFYQADNTTTRKYEGAGIGLALVHELVKLMEGRLEIESEENKGSTFTITVTLLQPDKQSVYPELVPVAAGIKNLKVDTYQRPDPDILQKTDSLILIVEDNTGLRRFLYDSIEPAYKVITASNGEEGYQLAITQKPDLIISDVMMPVMDGFEFCNKIKNNPETSHIAFIILSAKTTSESKTTGLKRGADDYLTKPFSVDELLARIQNLLQRQVRRKEMQKQIFELEAKALRAQMNPHFIFNCMNSIKALIQNDDKARSVEYLTTFAKLIRTLLENSDKRQISLHDEIETCQLYTKLEMMRLNGKLDCRFNIDPNADLKYLMVPALIIQPFIENAIWHGIVPKEKGTIQINVKGENKAITCEIDDDGIGRELSQLNKPVSTAKHESRGVHISQTRLNLQKMLNETGATIEIRDKYNGNKPTGTRVVIAFHQN